MRVFHTADWYIGQLFHEYDRTDEHQQFLNWLLGTFANGSINVMLINGDIFDLPHPSAASIKMFYSFLYQVAVSDNMLLECIFRKKIII